MKTKAGSSNKHASAAVRRKDQLFDIGNLYPQESVQLTRPRMSNSCCFAQDGIYETLGLRTESVNGSLWGACHQIEHHIELIESSDWSSKRQPPCRFHYSVVESVVAPCRWR